MPAPDITTSPHRPRLLAYTLLVIVYLCGHHAVPVGGPNAASFYQPLMPVSGTLTTVLVLVLGERIHAYHTAGFVLVFAGLLLTSRR